MSHHAFKTKQYQFYLFNKVYLSSQAVLNVIASVIYILGISVCMTRKGPCVINTFRREWHATA